MYTSSWFTNMFCERSSVVGFTGTGAPALLQHNTRTQSPISSKSEDDRRLGGIAGISVRGFMVMSSALVAPQYSS